MEKKVTVLLVIRVITVLVGLFFLYRYNVESTMIEDSEAYPYEITEVYCSNGGKASSYIKVKDRGKMFEVEVSGWQNCTSFKEGEKVQLYYNHLFDYYFFKENHNSIKITLCLIFFGLTFLWTVIERYKTNNQNHK